MTDAKNRGGISAERRRDLRRPHRPPAVPLLRAPGTVCVKMLRDGEWVVAAEFGVGEVRVHDEALYGRLMTARAKEAERE